MMKASTMAIPLIVNLILVLTFTTGFFVDVILLTCLVLETLLSVCLATVKVLTTKLETLIKFIDYHL